MGPAYGRTYTNKAVRGELAGRPCVPAGVDDEMTAWVGGWVGQVWLRDGIQASGWLRMSTWGQGHWCSLPIAPGGKGINSLIAERR